MYYKLYILFVLFVFGVIDTEAQTISLFDYKLDEYPKITAKFYSSDENGNPISNLSPLDFTMYENQQQQTVNSVFCPIITDTVDASIIMSIDKSSYWSNEQFDNLKGAYQKFIEFLFWDKSEVALSVFDDKPYLLSHFSSDEIELLSALDNISISGSVNIEETLISDKLGMFRISENAAFDQKYFILIANKHDSLDYNSILNLLNDQDIVLYTIFVENKVDTDWQNLVLSGGGIYYSNVSQEEDFIKVFLHIARDIQNIQPCELIWRNEVCDINRDLEIEIDDYGIENDFNYQYPINLLPHIQFSDLGYLEYGLIPKGTKHEKTISITARNTEIHVKNILRTSTLFTITDYGGSPPDFTLVKDESRQIRIEFFAADTHYIHTEFEIKTDICTSNKFYASAGSKKGSVIKETIEVIDPNGGEEIVAGSLFPIHWEGILPIDTVYIDLSLDGGETWDPIIRKTTNLIYDWKVPTLESDECLVRVDHVSRSDNYEKIHFLYGHSAGINGLSWSPQGSKLASSAYDDSVKIWDPITESLIQTIYNEDEKIKSSNWSPDTDEYIISAVDKPYALILISDRIDSVHALDGIVKFAAWSAGGSSKLYASCGTDEGKVYIWEYRGTQQDQVFISELAGHSGDIKDISWNNFNSIVATAGTDGKLILWDPLTGELISELFDYTYQLNSISWSPNGNYLAVAGDNNIIEIWDVQSKEMVQQLSVNSSSVTEVSWGPSNIWIAAASAHDVYLWNVTDFSLYYIYTIHDNTVSEIEWREDSKYIATGDLNSSVQVWDPTQIPFENHIIQSDMSDDVFEIVDPLLDIENISFNPTTINIKVDSVFSSFITNPSDFPIRIDSIRIEKPFVGIFNLRRQDMPVVLLPNKSLTVEFSFQPPQNRFFNANVFTYSQNRVYQSKISGGGVPDRLLSAVNNYDFAKVLLSDSVERLFPIVKNVSINDVRIKSIELISFTSEFSINNNPQSLVLGVGDDLDLNIKYRPNFIGPSGAEIVIVYENLDSVIKIQLYGEGVAPRFDLSDIDFGNLKCTNGQRDSVFDLSNIGTGALKISSIIIQGNDPQDFDYSISSIDTLFSGNQRNITISFVPKSTGIKSAELVIEHNTDERYSTIHKYQLTGSSDSVAFRLEKDILLFEDLGASETKRDIFKIYNDGDVPLDWTVPIDYEFFTIESIVPNPTPVGSSSEITVLFKGGKADTSYIQDHDFIDKCSHTNRIQFIANTGKENAIADVNTELNFPIKICESIFDTIIVIYNIGTSPLIITDIEIDESSDDVFSLCDDFQEFAISPGGSGDIKICVNAEQNGFYSGKLNIKSNSTDSELIEIKLSAQKESYDYNLSPNDVVFSNVTSNIEYYDTIVVFNIGTLPITWTFPITIGKFILEKVEPQITEPGMYSEIIVKFIGGDKGESYSEIFSIPDLCNTNRTLSCIANVKGSNYAVLSTGSLKAKPGEKVIIPIVFTNPESISLLDFTGIEATIIFDASLLVPTEDQYSGIIIDGQRVIDISTIDNIEVGEIFNLECIATLGSSKSTEIRFENVRPVGTDNYFMESESGSFELILDCELDTNRFIWDAGIVQLSDANPNPANDLVSIDFHIIESGKCRIDLYDIYGDKVANLFDEFVRPGDYNIIFDVKNLPSGNYIYKMTTFSQTFVRKLIILK